MAGKFNTETYIQYFFKRKKDYTYFQSKQMNFKSKHNADFFVQLLITEQQIIGI